MLRPYQIEMIEKSRELMRQGKKRILFQLSTGGGKTVMLANMFKSAVNKGNRCYFMVHRVELIKQTAHAFDENGIKDFGIVSPRYQMNVKAPIQICSVQTMNRRFNKLPPPALVGHDEAHHCPAKTWAKLFSVYDKAFHIGLSATPKRLDGSGLGEYFDDMVIGPSMSHLIENKFLSPYKIYAPSNVNTSGLHMRGGDFVKEEISSLMDKPTITGDAISHYKKYCHGKKAVVFAASIEHSNHVVSQFNIEGIPAEHIDGNTPDEQRSGAIRRFSEGKTFILSNVDLIGEGLNIPSIEAIILLRPTASVGLYLQQIGRSLRYIEGKTAIILDHVGNCSRHGLPDDDRDWSLDGSKKKKTSATEASTKIRTCPKCFACQVSGGNVCKYCGFEFPVEAREVEQKEGDLVEVDVEALRKVKKVEQGQANTLEKLIELGKSRGYKNAAYWARCVLNNRKTKK